MAIRRDKSKHFDETKIVKHHPEGNTRDSICAALHVRSWRVSGTLDTFRRSGSILTLQHSGRPKNAKTDVFDYIDVRRIQFAKIIVATLTRAVSRMGIHLVCDDR
jgi:hypothetical protein